MASTKRTGKGSEGARRAPPEDEEGLHGIPKDAQLHFANAASEFAIAMETVSKNFVMPEEARKHAFGAHKEMLLMFRSLIDAHLERCDKEEKMGPSTGLRRIKVE
ncbi:MAG: hypothetical protein LUO79_02055 [Methanomassiliicoccales archaeon]|nr:hypothetical protein [Methanomassiliicoccales archaeon]